jgi:hypothetical protein
VHLDSIAGAVHRRRGCDAFTQSDYVPDAQGDWWHLVSRRLPGPKGPGLHGAAD